MARTEEKLMHGASILLASRIIGTYTPRKCGERDVSQMNNARGRG
jgi:hypothetical protein